KTLLFGQGQTLHSPITPIYQAHNPNVAALPYDLEKARQLLRDAGWSPGPDGILLKDGQRFAFTLHTTSGNPVREGSAVVAQDQYKKLGIQVDVQILEASAFLNKLRMTHDFDAVIWGNTLQVDPDQTSFWATREYPNGDNYLKYSNPRVDQLLEQARTV